MGKVIYLDKKKLYSKKNSNNLSHLYGNCN